MIAADFPLVEKVTTFSYKETLEQGRVALGCGSNKRPRNMLRKPRLRSISA